MKYSIPAMFALAALTASASVFAESDITYDITLQNEGGAERRSVTLLVGSGLHELQLVGGSVTITPPASVQEMSIIQLYAQDQRKPGALHTARIGPAQGNPVRIAYTVCGGRVTYQSPAPDKPAKCEGQSVSVR